MTIQRAVERVAAHGIVDDVGALAACHLLHHRHGSPACACRLPRRRRSVATLPSGCHRRDDARASSAFVSCTAAVPTPPAAPCTSNVSPAFIATWCVRQAEPRRLVDRLERGRVGVGHAVGHGDEHRVGTTMIFRAKQPNNCIATTRWPSSKLAAPARNSTTPIIRFHAGHCRAGRVALVLCPSTINRSGKLSASTRVPNAFLLAGRRRRHFTQLSKQPAERRQT